MKKYSIFLLVFILLQNANAKNSLTQTDKDIIILEIQKIKAKKFFSQRDEKIIILATQKIIIDEGFTSCKYDDIGGQAVGYGMHRSKQDCITKERAIKDTVNYVNLLYNHDYKIVLKRLYPPVMNVANVATILSILYNTGLTKYLDPNVKQILYRKEQFLKTCTLSKKECKEKAGKIKTLHQKLVYCKKHNVKIEKCRVREEMVQMHPKSEPHMKRRMTDWLMWSGDKEAIALIKKTANFETRIKEEHKNYHKNKEFYKIYTEYTLLYKKFTY